MYQEKRRRLQVAIDFDGVLTNTRGLSWPTIGPTRRLMVGIAKFIQNCGHEIILNTCRCGHQLTDAMVLMCSQHYLVFDYYNENSPEVIDRYGGDARKISADYYIDDKACFSIYIWAIYVAIMCYFRSPLRRRMKSERKVAKLLDRMYPRAAREATEERGRTHKTQGPGCPS